MTMRNRSWIWLRTIAPICSSVNHRQIPYLMGDVGILLCNGASPRAMLWLIRSLLAIAANMTNPARKLMWGAPGTMSAALSTSSQVATNAGTSLCEKCCQLLSEWERDAQRSCYVWPGLVWTVEYLPWRGAWICGKCFRNPQGSKISDAQTLELAESRARETAERSVRADAAYANWPAGLGGSRQLFQHCHGAPGMITCLADLPSGADEVFDQLLAKGGELIWRAGPLTKGPNLCHGTAGNGYAFLKLYRRTGDEKVAGASACTAMHAIEQSERHAREYGHRRYPLWTGDIGLAVYRGTV